MLILLKIVKVTGTLTTDELKDLAELKTENGTQLGAELKAKELTRSCLLRRLSCCLNWE